MTKGSLVEHYVGLVALGMFLHAVSAAVSSPPASESSTPKRRGSLLPSRPAWLVARTKERPLAEMVASKGRAGL
jgi:hypothetical protein